jgi:hypothetical protein
LPNLMRYLALFRRTSTNTAPVIQKESAAVRRTSTPVDQPRPETVRLVLEAARKTFYVTAEPRKAPRLRSWPRQHVRPQWG